MNSRSEGTDAMIHEEVHREVSAAIPTSVDLWPGVLARIAAAQATRSEPPRRLRLPSRHVSALAIASLLLLGALGIAVAASPAIRHLIPGVPSLSPGQFGAGSSASGMPIFIHPSPGFRVFYPYPRPQGVPVYVIQRVPNGGSSMGFQCPAPHMPAHCDALARAMRVHSGIPSILRPFTTGTVDAIMFGLYSFSANGPSIEIVEWSAAERPVSGLGQVIINGIPASERTTGKETTVTLVRQGTALSVHTNLGDMATLGLIRSLRIINVSGKS